MARKFQLRDGNLVRDAIGLFLILAFIGAMVALLWKAIPKENEQLLSYMLGQLSGFVAGVVGFWYISKSGEKELEAKRTENTNEALKAIRAAQSSPAVEVEGDDVIQDGDSVTVQKEP